MQLISIHWFYILQLSWIHGLALAIFWWSLLGFPHTLSCCLQRVKVWLPPCWFGWLIFHCVILWLRPGLPTLYWITMVRMDSFVVFLTYEESSQSFPTEDDISSGSLIYGFYDLEGWSFSPYFFEGFCFYQERILYFVKNIFNIYWEDQVVLVLFFFFY